MEELLQGLLIYSRVGRTKERLETFNIRNEFNNIVAMLDPPAGYRLELVDNIGEIQTNAVPLRTCLRNLISNAIKHSDRDDLVVRTICESDDDFFHFTVSDNGPGIPKKDRTAIFGIFKTLKPRDELEASGLGLAIVKKTVEYAKGTIDVNESPIGGASFHFSWAKDRTPTKHEETLNV